MPRPLDSTKAKVSLENLDLALGALQRFLAQPSSEVQQAGVIWAFEFTFEQFWKTFKRLAEAQGLSAPSPKAALAQAFQLGWIGDEELWLDMLEDRNRTSHAYHQTAAEEIFGHIKDRYLPAFLAARAKLH